MSISALITKQNKNHKIEGSKILEEPSNFCYFKSGHEYVCL
jgi:hypothetical protein